MRPYRFKAMAALLPALCSVGTAALAQTPPAPHDSTPPAQGSEQPSTGRAVLHLSASLAGEPTPVANGVIWRVFDDRPEPDGSHRLIAQSEDAQPNITLPNGHYTVHAAYGYASAMTAAALSGIDATRRLIINAGAIKVKGDLGGALIPPDKLSLAIYVPERGNSEAKLVVSNAKPGQIIRLPEGLYHVVSTYLDTVGVGSLTPVTDTNSVVNADLRVQAGKLVEATVRHRAAVLTLKLVNAPGGEALANTSFTILTPGGDIIRELIGAFPSLVLAEGDYLVIARHDGKTFQSEFKVESNLDRDVEVLAHSQP